MRVLTSSNRLTRRVSLAAGLLTLVAACSPRAFPETSPHPSPVSVATEIVYLIGDAGYATPGSPVIRQLREDVALRSVTSEVAVVFLGDNIYPAGLRDPSNSGYPQDVAHLDAQIDILRNVAARGVFVPGNHDWDDSGKDGLAAVKRQGAFLDSVRAAGVRVEMQPEDGCPGPTSLELGESVLLVFIDTSWWLFDKSLRGGETCPYRNEGAVLEALRRILIVNEAGERRQVVVSAHHPLDTYGPHGGYFGVKDMFFPLTNAWGPLYIPIPALYPMVRNSGVTVQDQSNPTNARMRRDLALVFSEFETQPLIFAGGHDHDLEVFEGAEYGVGYILVSGAGSTLHNVGNADAEFAVGLQEGELGYMRVEFFPDRPPLLTVLTDGTQACGGLDEPGCSGASTVRHWRWLTVEKPVEESAEEIEETGERAGEPE